MRRTRHRRRFHTDRVVANRRAQYERESSPWSLRNWNWRETKRYSYGALADRSPWDCGSHCLLCHGAKFVEPRRARENRRWREVEARAY